MSSVVLVTGSRTWDDAEFVRITLNAAWFSIGPSMVLMHGACPDGADELADQWAALGRVPVIRVPADWKRDGRAAGILRNMRMVDMGPLTHCVAFIRDDSRGATHCASYARSRGVPTTIHTWDARW